MGSILGLILVSQILTGFFLTFYYRAGLAFESVQYIIYEVNCGWIFRVLHSNGASLFFICVYVHIFKGLIYRSYRLIFVWLTGVLIYFLMMGIAFTGYVLIWGQMSYWAAVVITSLITSIPIFGKYVVWWIWGGFSVCGNTLRFFYSVHFILPWVIFVLVIVHLLFLHYRGRSSLLFVHSDYEKIQFFPGFWFKDALNLILFFLLVIYVLSWPFEFRDPMMFVESDSMVSPTHVVPEWYFLYAFTILRAVPNKFFGVVLMFGRVFILILLIYPKMSFMTLDNFLFFLSWSLVWDFFWLTWAGCYPTDYPFNIFNLVFTVIYFFIVVAIVFLNYLTKILMG